MKKVFFILCQLCLVFVWGCADEPAQLSDEEQLQKDIEIIDVWLDSANIKALTNPSGLRYVITAMGTGAKPKLTNKVTVKYSGKFLKKDVAPDVSVVFDKSTVGITYPLSNFIQGWQIGFQLLPKGSKATLYIPSGLAYGKNGAGNSIPPNANLFFDVELVDLK